MFAIVGKRFSPAEFRAYVAGLTFSRDFQPAFVVVHNTGSPTLAQRPQGFTSEHMANLQDYYANKQGWRGGPHCFVDDKGIWVFNPLTLPGVHSPSWNRSSWGVELLGEYASDSPNSGRGAKVVDMGAMAVAILLDKINVAADEKTMRFHFEDRLTDHACPGKLLTKPLMLGLVKAALATLPHPEHPDDWTVKDASGRVLHTGVPLGAGGTSLVRASVEAAGGKLAVDNAAKIITVIGAAKAEG